MTTSTTSCWSCGKDRAQAEPLCPHCGKVQPPAGVERGEVADKFAVFGFARAYDLDEAQLEERFRALSRKLHPDRFARATPRERRFSLEQTTWLNDAHRTLRDPVRRAEHLLELRGLRVAREGEKQPPMPPEFLEEAMDDREKLLEAKASGEAAQVAALAQGVRQKQRTAMDEIAAHLRAGDETKLPRTAELLSRLRYYARYLDEVEGKPPEL